MKLFTKILVALIVLCWIPQAKAALIINEVMVDPDAVSDAKGEWFELYNNGDTDIDINGWIIKDAGGDYHQIDNGGSLIVSANGFLVLGRNGEPSLNGGYIPDYAYDGFQLANSEDEIILKDSGAEIVRIDYAATWPIYTGRSLAYSGSGDINDPSNWFATPAEPEYIFGDGDYGTPGAPNLIPEPMTLVLMSGGLLPILVKRRRRKNK